MKIMVNISKCAYLKYIKKFCNSTNLNGCMKGHLEKNINNIFVMIIIFISINI
jgi:hypothetical protein